MTEVQVQHIVIQDSSTIESIAASGVSIEVAAGIRDYANTHASLRTFEYPANPPEGHHVMVHNRDSVEPEEEREECCDGAETAFIAAAAMGLLSEVLDEAQDDEDVACCSVTSSIEETEDFIIHTTVIRK